MPSIYLATFSLSKVARTARLSINPQKKQQTNINTCIHRLLFPRNKICIQYKSAVICPSQPKLNHPKDILIKNLTILKKNSLYQDCYLLMTFHSPPKKTTSLKRKLTLNLVCFHKLFIMMTVSFPSFPFFFLFGEYMCMGASANAYAWRNAHSRLYLATVVHNGSLAHHKKL